MLPLLAALRLTSQGFQHPESAPAVSTSARAHAPPGHATTWKIPSWAGSSSQTLLWFEDGTITIIPVLDVPRSPSAHFLLPTLHWKGAFPELHATRLVRHAQYWFEKVPFLDLPALSILRGQYRLPQLHGEIQPFHLPNLPTVHLAPGFIEEMVSLSLAQGILESCHPDYPPKCSSALGLVPKASTKTPW
eukprot:2171103-Rhodomonas_salina.1